MKTLRLGKTGLAATQIGLGTVELGLDYGFKSNDGHKRPSESDASHLLNEALDLGIGFIDTARMYGASEEIIGSALSGRRGEFTLATKVAPIPDGMTSRDSLRAHIDQSVAASLRALRTDHIDLLMLHSLRAPHLPLLSPLTEALRTWQYFGYVGFIGASVYEDSAEQALESSLFDCLQIAHNALDRNAEQSLLPGAHAQGVGVVIRSVLLKGMLTDRYRSLPEEMRPLREAIESLESLARAAGISLPELAFRYALHADAVLLTGTARIEELRETLRYTDAGPLDEQLVAAIRSIEVSDPAMLNPDRWSWAEIA